MIDECPAATAVHRDSPRLPAIAELLFERVQAAPTQAAYFEWSAQGRWRPVTWAKHWQDVCDCARGLQSLGFKPGDRLAIQLHPCRLWEVLDKAVMLLGGCVAGLDQRAGPEHCRQMLELAQPDFLALPDAAALESFRPYDLSRLKGTILMFEDEPAAVSACTWEMLRTRGRTGPQVPFAETDTDEPAVIVFTSGTTGTLKAIPFSQAQVLAAVRSALERLSSMSPGERFAGWLPLSNMLQRLINLCAVARGFSIYFVEDPRLLAERLQQIKPTVFVGVPRLYEKVYAGIQDRIRRLPAPLRSAVRMAERCGAAYAAALRAKRRPSFSLRLTHAAADALVLRQLRRFFGGRVKLVLSGSAPMPVWLLEQLHALGLLVLEGYGLSEHACLNALSTPEAYRFGSVGRPCPGVSVKLSPAGEVLVKSPAIMRGYLHGRAVTAPVDRFEGDYLRTGDFGVLDEDGFLYLTGRVADLIKTSTGRRIAPAAIEGVLGRCPYLEQVVVVGEGQKHLAALATLNLSALQALGREFTDSREALCRSAAVRSLIEAEFERLNQELADYEQVRSFDLLPIQFTVENGLLTTSLKVRRREAINRFGPEIAKLFHAETRHAGPVLH